MHLPWTPPRLITAATSYSGGIIRYSIIREEMTDTRTRDCTSTVLYYDVFLMGKLQCCIIPREHDAQNALFELW